MRNFRTSTSVGQLSNWRCIDLSNGANDHSQPLWGFHPSNRPSVYQYPREATARHGLSTFYILFSLVLTRFLRPVFAAVHPRTDLLLRIG